MLLVLATAATGSLASLGGAFATTIAGDATTRDAREGVPSAPIVSRQGATVGMARAVETVGRIRGELEGTALLKHAPAETNLLLEDLTHGIAAMDEGDARLEVRGLRNPRGRRKSSLEILGSIPEVVGQTYAERLHLQRRLIDAVLTAAVAPVTEGSAPVVTETIRELLRAGFMSTYYPEDRLMAGSLGWHLNELLQGTQKMDPGEAMVATLVRMGPGYVKLGQLLGTRQGLVRDEYRGTLRRLVDTVPRGDETELLSQFYSDLKGKVPEPVWQEIIDSYAGSEPLGVGSVAQTHAVRAGGEEWVIKILKRRVRGPLRRNLENMQRALSRVSETVTTAEDKEHVARVTVLVDELRDMVASETDLRQEAAATRRAEKALRGPDSETPSLGVDVDSENFLILERLDGGPALSVAGSLTPAQRLAVANGLFYDHLASIFVHGFVHGDPTAGNLLLAKRGDRLVRQHLDFGLSADVPLDVRRNMAELIFAVQRNNPERATDVLLRMSTDVEHPEALRAAVNAQWKGADDGRLLERVASVVLTAQTAGVKVDRVFALVGKAMYQLEGLAKDLSPQFDSQMALKQWRREAIRRGPAMAGAEIEQRAPRWTKGMVRGVKARFSK